MAVAADTFESPAPGATPAAGTAPVAPLSPPPAAWQAHFCPLPDSMTALVHPRMVALVQIQRMHQQRQEARQNPDLPDDARDELDRQDREARRPLSAEQAKKAGADQQQRDQTRHAAVEAGQIAAPSPEYAQALQGAYEQWRLFAEWDALRPKILDTAWTLAQNEPLLVILQRGQRSPQALFSWAVYGAVLRSFRRWAGGQHSQALAKLAKLHRQPLERASLEGSADLLAQVVAAAERDQALVEEQAVKAFWEQYQEAAALWLGGTVADHELPVLRAFLRYGMIGGAPWFLSDDLARTLLQSCSQEIPPWDSACSANHVLYADEYLWYAGHGIVTPSIDEDLDLNGRGKLAWKRDKAWRRVVYGRERQRGLIQTLGRLDERIAQLEKAPPTRRPTPAPAPAPAPGLDPGLAPGLAPGSLPGAAPGAAGASATGEHQVDPPATSDRSLDPASRDRIEAMRLTRVRDRLRDHTIPDERQWHSEAVQRLMQLGPPPHASDLARQEARQVRRVCWLAAKLKDRFPPFTLAENFRPDTAGVHTREMVLEEVANLEKLDTCIFQEALNPASKAPYRVYMRQPPYILLTPGCGFLGLSWNPRSRTDVGRMAIPLYGPRPGLLKGMLSTIAADFRWDTSRESAGMDVLRSDTLVAAYATVRWEYRRASLRRREAVGFGKGSDRIKWRGHYATFLASAMEGGRKLCFKCPEVYTLVLKYIGLPPGIQPFR